ncbi:hypothetical protein QFZ75_007105 [Streptomyces sp. V3I8]|nr:hypothetical protein [Streptomyces sp. V3I8]
MPSTTGPAPGKLPFAVRVLAAGTFLMDATEFVIAGLLSEIAGDLGAHHLRLRHRHHRRLRPRARRHSTSGADRRPAHHAGPCTGRRLRTGTVMPLTSARTRTSAIEGELT